MEKFVVFPIPYEKKRKTKENEIDPCKLKT